MLHVVCVQYMTPVIHIRYVGVRKVPRVCSVPGRYHIGAVCIWYLVDVSSAAGVIRAVCAVCCRCRRLL